MADSLIVWEGLPGLSVHLELRTGDPQSDPLNAETALIEDDDEPGYYTLIVPEALAGRFRWRVALSGVAVDSGWITLTDTAGPFFVQDAAGSGGVVLQRLNLQDPRGVANAVLLNWDEDGETWTGKLTTLTGAPITLPSGCKFRVRTQGSESLLCNVDVSTDEDGYATFVIPNGLTDTVTTDPLLWSIRKGKLVLHKGPLWVSDAA